MQEKLIAVGSGDPPQGWVLTGGVLNTPPLTPPPLPPAGH
jgi:hypothetical protein